MRKAFRVCVMPLIFSGFLTHCVPLVVGGAAAAATAIYVHDQRSGTQQKADKGLQLIIQQKLNTPTLNQQCHIVVSVYDGVVLLAGQTPTPTLKAEVEQRALSVPGVIKLYNEIQVAAPTSSLTRVSDEWISTKISGKIINDTDLREVSVQIVVENGVVYLMGNLTSSQVNQLISMIKGISGVQKIVEVLSTAGKAQPPHPSRMQKFLYFG